MSNLKTHEPKLACAAWGWRELEIPEYFQWINDLKIDSVEVNIHPQAPKHLLNTCSDESVEKVAELAEEAGVSIHCLAARNDFTVQGESELEEQIQRVQRFVDMATRLGAKYVRIFSGGHRQDKWPNEIFAQLHYAFNRVGDYAESQDIKLAIENHGGPTGTPERIVKIMEGVKSPAVGLNYDPGNFVKFGGIDPLIALQQILPWVNYTHWKDVCWIDGNAEFCAIGEGDIAWQPIVQELLNAGYQGYWAIEYENPTDVQRGTQESIINLQKIIQEVSSQN
ncbi:MAG TPA: sugar phosphate isomerase/epimerase family protein [Nostocaceae cyanobacterium]|nr:sugar phosphate isomerase/epimerase family protein [Nostocaceae cyanobacterium]